MVLDLPIRDGNIATSAMSPMLSIVLDLPIRDGNSRSHRPRLFTQNVLDLPIRDGNYARLFILLMSANSFRPSYKGWKLIFCHHSPPPGLVLDLPIRDGNREILELAYRGSAVLDLPIRDGNTSFAFFCAIATSF